MVMNCLNCKKGKLKKQVVPFVRHGLFVGNFQAEVCSACGEKLFDEKEAEKMEKRTQELGLWGKQEATVYQVGGNLAIGIKKSLAQMFGISKGTVVRIFPQVNEKRFLVEVS